MAFLLGLGGKGEGGAVVGKLITRELHFLLHLIPKVWQAGRLELL